MKNVIVKVSYIVLIVLFSSSIKENYSQLVWSPLGTGTNGTVHALAIYSGYLIAAGSFFTAGGQNVNHIARWNGTSWSALGLGTNDDIFALAIYNSNLVVAGRFTTAGGLAANRIAMWNGTAWSTFGTGLNDDVYALIVANSDLIVGGAFTAAGGVNNILRIARWYNGWTGVGSGFNDTVFAVGVFNSQVFAGGSFTMAGAVETKKIAVWSGSVWQPLVMGVDNGSVYSLRLQSFSIAIGGSFTTIGGSIVNRIARWNGYSWNTVGSGFDNSVYALFPSGSTNLYAGGRFSYADFQPAPRAAYFISNAWTPLGTGIGGSNSYVKAIASYGGRIVFGGSFSTAGGNAANNIAVWGTPLGIRPIGENIPGEFSLQQNYPNPFNPVTTIRFGLPKEVESDITLTVYDISGRVVAELFNGKLSPGSYEIDFDGTNLSSAAYFYRLVTGEFTETKKMLLIK